MDSIEILDREFLLIRSKILEIAASLDRMDRSTGDQDSDPRMKLIQQGLEILAEKNASRAEAVQLLFSKEYSADWQQDYKFEPRF